MILRTPARQCTDRIDDYLWQSLDLDSSQEKQQQQRQRAKGRQRRILATLHLVNGDKRFDNLHLK
jgi:hypothetical protein